MLNNNLSLSIKEHDLIILADYSNNFFDSNSINKIENQRSS